MGHPYRPTLPELPPAAELPVRTVKPADVVGLSRGAVFGLGHGVLLSVAGIWLLMVAKFVIGVVLGLGDPQWGAIEGSLLAAGVLLGTAIGGFRGAIDARDRANADHDRALRQWSRVRRRQLRALR